MQNSLSSLHPPSLFFVLLFPFLFLSPHVVFLWWLLRRTDRLSPVGLVSGRAFQRSMFIEAHPTPNINSLKFHPGRAVLEKGTMDFPNAVSKTRQSPSAIHTTPNCRLASTFLEVAYMSLLQDPAPRHRACLRSGQCCCCLVAGNRKTVLEEIVSISTTWKSLKPLDTQCAESCDGLPFGQVALPHRRGIQCLLRARLCHDYKEERRGAMV